MEVVVGRYGRRVTDLLSDRDPTDIRNAPPPDYVVTVEDRERWDLAGKIAEVLWEAFEPGEPLDPRFYWMMQRGVCGSDVPTETASDAEGP